MQKEIKKVISIIFVLSIMVLCGCLASCTKDKDEYVEDMFMAYIGADYKNLFMEQEITVDDFENEYIEKVDYDHEVWYSNEPEMGVIYIKLKAQYKDKLDEVMKQVKDLSFVMDVEKIAIYHLVWHYFNVDTIKLGVKQNEIKKKFMTDQTDYTSFTVYPLYSQDEKLTCFLVEFEPCGFFFVGFNSADSFPFRSMYKVSTGYGESYTWSPYTVDETNSQPFPETDKCYKVDENGDKICYSKSPYSVTQNLDKKKYLIESEDGYICAIKKNDVYINLISLTEFDISKGDLEKEQAILSVAFYGNKRFDL